ncbi:MAG TPA: glycosyltransferase family 39 protein, partial [bacterium]|nr:glycosyltransferase family 39 protein [bacterium]
MNRHALFLGGVVTVAAALRLPGLDWGLPWALHIDERLFVVAKAIRLEQSLQAGTGPDPGITSYGILPLWLLVAARALFLDAATTSGPPIHGDPFAATVFLARAISALWSIATVWLVGRWAMRWGTGVGLGAAALTAGFPALLQSAHFGTVEAPLVALIAGGMLAAERVAESPGRSRLIGAGLVLGLALSVKAPGALLLLPLLHAASGSGWRVTAARLAWLLVPALLLVVALNPALLGGA